MTDPRGTRRWIVGILGLQVVLALLLFSADLVRVLPAALYPSEAPDLTSPYAPGDQVRRYRPADVTIRNPAPGTRPLPSTADMPSRLLFEMADWDGARALSLTGQIEAGDADRLADWLAARDTPRVVFLNSPGGSVRDALAIGRLLRDLGAATELSETDICLSACPYILAGGVQRQVAEGAWVGIHQHYFGENTALPAFLAVEDIQRGQGEVMAYLIEMGIDPAIMQPALMTPPDEIYLLVRQEMLDFGLVTSGDS